MLATIFLAPLAVPWQNVAVCGSVNELLVILAVLLMIMLISAASKARAPTEKLRNEKDDGIRVRFLPDEDDDERKPH